MNKENQSDTPKEEAVASDALLSADEEKALAAERNGTITEEVLEAGRQLAKKACEKNDAETIRRLYEGALSDIQTLANGMAVVMTDHPAPRDPSEAAITAIKEVALASVALARDIAVHSDNAPSLPPADTTRKR